MFKSLSSACFLALAATTVQAGEMVDYSAAGGTYEGYHAPAQGASKGAVIVIHDWDGLTDYEVQRADMLAAMGYDAFAVDLYGKDNRPDTTSGKKAEVGKLYQDREKMRTLILAGIETARARGAGDVVVMGYCFGGSAVLELARSGKASGVKGFTTFHGGLKTPDGQSYMAGTAPILITHGGADSGIPMSQVAELSEQLEAAKVPYEIQVYSGAPHAFTVFGSDRYREVADKQSWAAFAEFLKENLGG